MSPDLFRALKLEKAIMFIILLLVVLVAGLNLAGTLILVTMEKTREIGILRAMECRAAPSAGFSCWRERSSALWARSSATSAALLCACS